MNKEDILRLNVKELKYELGQLKLSTAGHKAELWKRLLEHHLLANSTLNNTLNEIDNETLNETRYSDATDTVYKEQNQTIQRNTFTLKDIQESLSQFSGVGEPDVERWIDEFEDNAAIVNWDEIQKYILYGKQLITGAARIFIRSQPKAKNWQELKNVLLNEFQQKPSAIDIHAQLQKRRKRYNESYLEYPYTIMEIGNKVKLDERSIIEYFIEGINDVQANKIILYDAKDIADLKQKIICYEKMKMHSKKYDYVQNTGQNVTRPKRYEHSYKYGNRNEIQEERVKKQYSNKKCSLCPNLSNHSTEECWKNLCFKCKKSGHKSFECKQNEKQAPLEQNKKFNKIKTGKEVVVESNTLKFPFKHSESKKTESIDNLEVPSDNNDCYRIEIDYMTEKLKMPITIKGVELVGLYDSGSDVSIMKKSMFDKIGNLILFPYKINIRGVGQGKLRTIGYTIVRAKLKNVEINLVIHISDDEDMLEVVLIGADAIKQIEVYLTESGPTFILKRQQEPLEEVLHKHMLGTTDIVDSTFIAGRVFQSICNDLTMDIESPVEVSHLEKGSKGRLLHILANYQPNKIKSPQVEMKIVVKDDVPVFQRPRRFPLGEQKIIQNQIEEWLKNGIIKPSSSEYAAQILLVNKKDGSKRLCGDYRKINEKIVRDNFPMVLIDEVLAKLQKAKVFTTLDLKNGFFHVPIAPESQKYTAIVTQQGQYEFTKVPFGMKNSPAAFCRYITAIFHKLIQNNTIMVYMDDIVIPSQTEEENFEKLEVVLKVASEHGLEINLKKSQFIKTEINFLGYIITASTISPGKNKVKAVAKFPKPKDIKSVQKFLGLTSYFRRFVPEYAEIARPLSDLLAKHKQFKFDIEESIAFEQLKECLINAPVLQIFNPHAQTQVHTDASIHGFGAALMQKQTEDNKWHPVEYMSKKTSNLERKYCSYELEVLAIVQALKKWRIYLLGIQFTIITDCNAFTQTVKKKDLPARIARWVMFLEEFDYEIEHRVGSRMKHVDALSRVYCNLMQGAMSDRIEREQEKDEWTKTIKELLKKQKHEDFYLKNNILFKDSNKELLVIPESMEREIIETAHKQGHWSIKKTIDSLQKNYYIKNITQKVTAIVRACIQCIITEYKTGKKESFLNPIEKENKPLHTYHIDHLGPLENTNKKYNHIFAIVDGFSKFLWLYPTKSTGTQEVIKALEKQSAIFGNPNRIISDRGTAFTSTAFKEYCKEQDINHVQITTGVPRANGQIERMNRIVIALLTKLCAENPQNWYKYLYRVQQTINSTVSRATQSTPFRVLTGLDMRLPGLDQIKNLLQEEEIKMLEEERNIERLKAKENILKITEENRRTFNRNRKKETEYEIGDIVAIKRTQFGTGLKIKPNFLGPYKVVKKKRNSRYEVVKIDEVEGPNKTTTMAENMKKWC